MRAARRNHTATVLLDGKSVLIAGGDRPPTENTLKQAEVFVKK